MSKGETGNLAGVKYIYTTERGRIIFDNLEHLNWYAKNEVKDVLVKLRNEFYLKGWHDIGCPAHSNQMMPEKECNCFYGFVHEKLTEAIS